MRFTLRELLAMVFVPALLLAAGARLSAAVEGAANREATETTGGVFTSSGVAEALTTAVRGGVYNYAPAPSSSSFP